MRIYKRGKSILALTLVLLTLVMLVPLRQANAADIQTADIPVTIFWTNNPVNDDLPLSLTVSLTQSGPTGVVTNYRTVELSKTTSFQPTWSGQFSNVPDTTVGGTKYSYSVVWPGATGFTISASTSNVPYNGRASARYQFGGFLTSYDVLLNWAAGEPTGTTHPEVTVQLNNAKTATGNNPTGTITSPGTSVTFSGITGVVTAGKPVNVSLVTVPTGYTASYAFDGDHTFTVTLTYNSDFSGTITWLNAPRFNKPGVTITLTGKDSGGNIIKTDDHSFGRTDEDCISYTASGLDPNLTYSIVSVDSVSITQSIADDANYTVTSVSGHNITITRAKNPLFRVGVSMRWVDNGNKRERRPSETTVYLFRDGVYTGDAEQISAASGWSTIFYDQPYSDGAHIYQYSVRAHKIPYYWSRCTRLSNFGFLITQFYGRRSYDKPTTSAAPKVGDPTLFRTELTDMMRREAASNASATAALAGVTANAAETEPATVDFDTLKRINGDVVGWISLSGTSIDSPIVLGSNNTKYLSRLWSGEANSAGSIFMDYHNSGKFANKNTIIYGHNMQNGTMFNELLSYRNQNFYEANKSISLQTPYGDYALEPVAGFFTKEAYTNVAKYSFNSNSAFLSYVDTCIDNSDFQSETNVSATDKLVTLVTCSNDYDDGTRYLLVCKLTALD